MPPRASVERRRSVASHVHGPRGAVLHNESTAATPGTLYVIT